MDPLGSSGGGGSGPLNPPPPSGQLRRWSFRLLLTQQLRNRDECCHIQTLLESERTSPLPLLYFSQGSGGQGGLTSLNEMADSETLDEVQNQLAGH